MLAILLEEQRGIAAKGNVPTKTPKEKIMSTCDNNSDCLNVSLFWEAEK